MSGRRGCDCTAATSPRSSVGGSARRVGRRFSPAGGRRPRLGAGRSDELPSGAVVYLYRDMPDEVEVRLASRKLHRDENILVVDKPPFWRPCPARWARRPDGPGPAAPRSGICRTSRPAHRLDRLTAASWCSPCGARCAALIRCCSPAARSAKTYLARSIAESAVGVRQVAEPHRQTARHPAGRRNRVSPTPKPDPEPARRRVYRLRPRTGRTHQLRVHMAGLGILIHNDPLYPGHHRCPAGTLPAPWFCWRSAWDSTTRSPVGGAFVSAQNSEPTRVTGGRAIWPLAGRLPERPQ